MSKFNINIPQGKSGSTKERTYDEEGSAAMRARNTQRLDTAPGIEKEGYLDVSDLDRLRRRKLYTTV